MEYVTLGKSGLMVSRTAFGALPVQRVTDLKEATDLLRAAYEGGVNFFDTARSYSDSEEKLGLAMDEIRRDVIIATKSAARTGDDLRRDLETSLRNLQTDYIDLYQLHNPSFVPVPDGSDGLYDALAEAKAAGKIRCIGITNHSRQIALKAIESGLYDTLQYPFSYLADEADITLAGVCAEKDIGFIAMKALSGGLITNIPAAHAWVRQFENVVPIWGIQRRCELDQFLDLEKNPVTLDESLRAAIEKDRKELCGNFCRGCGYCLPCPAGIPINNANRMSQLLRRSPTAQWLTPEWQEFMGRIENCTKCGACGKRCPYGLKPWETLPAHLADYRSFLK
jgi:aryl-alcohol dehydrogenase-like predicted oxidoreductase